MSACATWSLTGWTQLKEVTGRAENSPAQPASPVDWVSRNPVSAAGNVRPIMRGGCEAQRVALLEPHRRDTRPGNR